MVDLTDLCNELYEDLNGQIMSVHQTRESLKIEIACDDWERPADNLRRFELAFTGVPEAEVWPGSISSISVLHEHPLLWRYSEPGSSIYFSSVPHNSYEVLGRVREAHERTYSGWRDLRDYLNACPAILDRGHGLLIRGPRPAIHAYALAIDGAIAYSIVAEHNSRMATSVPYRAFIAEDMYVVFQSCSIEEQPVAA